MVDGYLHLSNILRTTKRICPNIDKGPYESEEILCGVTESFDRRVLIRTGR